MWIREENKILLRSFRKNAHLIGLTVLFSLCAAVMEGASLGLLIPFLQSLSDPEAPGIQTGWKIVDNVLLGVGEEPLLRMYRICGFLLIAIWIRSLCSYLTTTYGMKSRAYVVEDLRLRIIDQLQSVSLRFFTTVNHGQILSSLTTELGRVSYSLRVLVVLITRGLLLVVYGAVAILVSWELSLIVVGTYGFMSLALTSLIRRIRSSAEKVTQANASFTSYASEFINGIRTITAFNAQGFERERLRRAANDIAASVIETSTRAMMVSPLSQGVVSAVLVGVIIVAVQFYILPGKLDMAFLLAFLFALFRMMPVVQQMNGVRGDWADMEAALASIADLLRKDNKPYLKDGTLEAPHIRKGITFEHVHFAYDPGEPVLEDVNIWIEAGKTTAIVGASGAGKSTLVDLVPRFFDPTSGRILLDGIDLRQLKVNSLRDRIAVVSQTAFIFNDSVRNNIAYGMPDLSLDRIRDAAAKANALEFIESMPDGFDTMLGDFGVRLSGGERQRIAIARAILRNPEILILDEATSALDSVSEKLVQQSLDRLMEGRTVIAIAHRLSTVEHSDWVVVLENGRVVEQGTYDELLERKEYLWKYHSIQFQLA